MNKFLIKYLFRFDPEQVVFLGSVKQKGTPIAIVQLEPIWRREKFLKKLLSIISFNWNPTEEYMKEAAYNIFMDSIFGNPADYANELYKINLWHTSQVWNFDHLTETDNEKVNGLQGITMLAHLKHEKMTSPFLHLNLGEQVPVMCLLLHAMVIKTPVMSIRHFLDLHAEFTFNSIRKANHRNSDDLISYIYELQTIQTKIALSLHEYVRLLDEIEKTKRGALLLNSEADITMKAENIFSYLKASVEKIIIVFGLIYNIRNLESKKSHKQKIDTLLKDIPENVKHLFYYEFIMDYVSSENLEELNKYRTGILHKKGISSLQPHSHIGKTGENSSLRTILETLIGQHTTNTAVLIGIYALLTDELVKLDRPEIEPSELPY